MVQPSFGGTLDTPRTNIGDATYLSRAPDFADISQEASFQSPTKDGNLPQQLRDGRSRGVSLRTPRRKGPLADRRNLPASVGGVEFTPMLKSATRNSMLRHGKENGAAATTTPALRRIEEDDITPIPRGETSMYTGSRSQSYLDQTMPHVESDSAASTPLALPRRRGGDKGPLQDGNQLSLREQENVIDRIEKENFGLKLKIHFLEEALRKAGPGFSEAALKENTELKVDKVTMQRDLHRYKKHLTTAERDLETYRQQMLELQEKAKKKYAGEAQRQEMDKLQQRLEDREAEIDQLQRQLDEGQRDDEQLQKLRDEIEDLEADLRDKDRLITEREDQLEDLKDRCDEAEDKAKDAQRKMVELEQAAQASGELEEAKDTIQDLEQAIRRLEEQLEDMKGKMEDAVAQRERAEDDLQELQEDLADKSMVTKGLSRQIEEKVARLQEELDQSSQDYATLEKRLAEVNQENLELKSKSKDTGKQREEFRQQQESMSNRIQQLEAELMAQTDAKNLLQTRHDSLTTESRSLQADVNRLEKEIEELERALEEEREHALGIEKDVRARYTDEIERLNDEISDLQAEVREKDNLYDNDSEKWATEKQKLESERQRAEEKAAGLQNTIDRLQEVEGTLSDKESKLKEAIQSEAERHKSEEAVLARQIEDLQDALETRQGMLSNLRNELSTVRDELRQSHINQQTQADKIAALEDEIDVLQTTLDEESGSGRQELQEARRECESLRKQLQDAQRAVERIRSERSTATTERSPQKVPADSLARIKWELSDAEARLEKTSKEKQTLQDQLAKINIELHTAKSSLAEVRAERDELEGELRRSKMHDNDTIRIDQERLDLRTAKLKLDNEVHRLKEENRALVKQRETVEKTLAEEIEKAAEEEERLSQEIMELQTRVRQTSASESQELSATRRKARELERRIEELQLQLATNGFPANIEGNSELSVMRKDLSAARQKELDFLQRESTNRDVVKGLKKQISQLERQLHEKEVSLLVASPASATSVSSRRGETFELRQQLSAALQSIHDLKSKSRDAERKASQASQHLIEQLNDVEDQKIVLEEVLEQARQQAEDAATQHERTLQRMKHKLEKLVGERNAAVASQPDPSKQDRHMRKTQAEMENLEHDVRQQQEMIDALLASEGSLRRKLERARSERAAYRMSSEKLQRDINRLKTAAADYRKSKVQGQQQSAAETKKQLDDNTNEALETVIRAAEGAADRHKKELRGMVMQMEWMQARWEREASLRADAAFAKKFIQLQLDVANACNKAQLRELEQIRTKLLGSRKALEPPRSGSDGKPLRLQSFLVMARFIARMRIASRDWAKQEAVRQKLSVAVQEQRRAKRAHQFKVVRVEAA
ncbi:hypothetical protein S40285_08910 [Stachybotrys chlorohalonatus IBT 40285]|uniref:Centrosomin N-terminal motif 1 domain-containing protein n=1 Tax=Stachybotrys chlorohalonatus (strain IBT 40285) TaxID=1283841 RepID=A0A084Q9F7_STAC4|nr:hypothetical protein S40285_08910 [Stachybotrys chlorohalonata IBT 40285]